MKIKKQDPIKSEQLPENIAIFAKSKVPGKHITEAYVIVVVAANER
jgi:hypothetical protein